MTAIQFGANDEFAGTGRGGAADRSGGLGQQSRDATVQNAVGLVDSTRHFDANDHSLGGGFNDFDAEGFVDADVTGNVFVRAFAHGQQTTRCR